jgi:hypothetical protein
VTGNFFLKETTFSFLQDPHRVADGGELNPHQYFYGTGKKRVNIHPLFNSSHFFFPDTSWF